MANDTILITNAISDIVFPPRESPIIRYPICGANINNNIKIIKDISSINLVAIEYVSFI